MKVKKSIVRVKGRILRYGTPGKDKHGFFITLLKRMRKRHNDGPRQGQLIVGFGRGETLKSAKAAARKDASGFFGKSL